MTSLVNGLSASTRFTGHLSNFQGGSSAESGSTSAFSTASTKVSWIAELATIFFEAPSAFKSSIESIIESCNIANHVSRLIIQWWYCSQSSQCISTFGRNAHRHKCLITHTYYSTHNSPHFRDCWVLCLGSSILKFASCILLEAAEKRENRLDVHSPNRSHLKLSQTNFNQAFNVTRICHLKGLALSILNCFHPNNPNTHTN